MTVVTWIVLAGETGLALIAASVAVAWARRHWKSTSERIDDQDECGTSDAQRVEVGAEPYLL